MSLVKDDRDMSVTRSPACWARVGIALAIGWENRPACPQLHQPALQALGLAGETLPAEATDRASPQALHLVPKHAELDQQLSEFVLELLALAGGGSVMGGIIPVRNRRGAAATIVGMAA
jgi:hypothetical protein